MLKIDKVNIDGEDYTLDSVERAVFSISECYSESIAFQKALGFVKENDEEFYVELLADEFEAMGGDKSDLEFVDEEIEESTKHETTLDYIKKFNEMFKK